MDAKELWVKRNEVMENEDLMNELKEDVDEITVNVLKADEIMPSLIDDHNKLSAEFEAEVAEATKHLEEKLERIKKEKLEIYQYKNYLLGNHKDLNDMVRKYTEANQKWKKSITEYTMKLEEYVNSGEVKDV